MRPFLHKRIGTDRRMESTAFFEKKISLSPSDFNEVKHTPVDELLTKKAKEMLENKCSEHGFVLPGSVQLLSRSMGYFESARFTGDAIYYLKLQGQVIYPVDGVRVTGKVIRKNKMGLYINYQDAIRIQVPRDLHLNQPEFEDVQVGDEVLVELKRSKFAINDAYILASGVFLSSNADHGVMEESPSDSETNDESPSEESETESETESESESESNTNNNTTNNNTTNNNTTNTESEDSESDSESEEEDDE